MVSTWESFIKLKQRVVEALPILPTWVPAGTRPKRGSEYSWRSLEIFSIYLRSFQKVSTQLSLYPF